MSTLQTKAAAEASVAGKPVRLVGRVVEALDPRMRIAGAVLAVVTVVALQSLWSKFAALVLIATFTAAVAPDLRLVMRRLAHVEGFMVVLLLLLPFTVPGTEIARFGYFAVTDRGLARAVSVVLSVNAAVLAVLALLATLEPARLTRGLGALGLPTALTHLLFFLIRYLGIFRDELAQSLQSMRARGFAPRLSRHTLRSYGNLAGMLLVRSIERAERVDEAMRCRGFSGRFPMRAPRPLDPIDYRFAAISVAAALALLIMDRLL
ncbi:MAG: cobalt ECF transporter T component CbiQ [Beijerinckiaceae bacterium]